MYYLHNRLIFVHKIQDVMFNSESNEELTPVPPNRGKHKQTVTTDIFTFCKPLLSCVIYSHGRLKIQC